MITRRKFLQVSTACAAAFIAPSLPSIGRASAEYESRAIFDEGLNWMNEQSARRVCERIKRAGFNVFIPCVWHGRGTVWPSALAPWDSNNREIPGYDPLATLTTIAQEHNLEVHPWFTVGLRQRHFFPELAEKPDSESFDYHRSAFRDFAVSLVMEVVNRYPVQGINLDFLRFSSPKPGYETQQESAVADVVRRISIEVKRVKPNLVISVCAAPWHPTIRQYGQDSPQWADEEIIDVIYSMQYQAKPDFEIVKQIQSRMRHPEALVVLVGNYERSVLTKAVSPRQASLVCDLLAQSRKVSLRNGVGLYLYSMLTDEQIELIRNNVFSTPARTRWGRTPRIPTNVQVK